MRILGLILAALSIPLIAIDSLAQGTSATQALVIKQGNVGIGTDNPKATLDVHGTVKLFGEWNSKKVNTPYHATTDGIVTAYVFGVDGNPWYSRVILYGKTDKTNPPKTTRVTTTWMWTPQSQYNQELGLTMPVRKGDYWEVTADYFNGGTEKDTNPLYVPPSQVLPCGNENCLKVYFLPFGKE